jgi:tetratricopeptide (TPR) repeat protein
VRDKVNIDEVLTAICGLIDQGELALFCGAGISTYPPSRLPTSNALKNAPLEGILASYPLDERRLILEYAVADVSLEEVFGVIYDELGQQLITAMARALDNDKLEPNKLHSFVAKALSINNLVITTNIDRLIERAFIKECPDKDLLICYNEETFQKFINSFERNKRSWLLKLHGTLRVNKKNVSESVAVTLNRIGKGLPSKTEQALRYVLERFPILFMGYGCGDLDIVYPVLAQVRSEKEIWWIKHEDEIPTNSIYVDDEIERFKKELPHVATVLLNRRKNGGKVFLIRYPTFKFIGELMKKLNWKLTQTEREGLSEAHWQGEFFCLGQKASKAEKASILATLARLGIGTEQGRKMRRQLAEFMQREYIKAIEASKNALKIARLYRELGFSMYLVDPEHGIEHYRRALKILEQVPPETKPILENAELFSRYALTYRRAYKVEETFKYSFFAWEAIPEELKNQLKDPKQDLKFIRFKEKVLTDREKSNLGNILRRLANTFHDLVSDPSTLSTAIENHRLEIQRWITEPIEMEVLKKAYQLAMMDRALQKVAGNIREFIQSGNVLGLIATKLGKVDEARKIHEEDKRVTLQLNWIGVEYAQACRNLGLAIEKAGNLNQAIDFLIEARNKFAREEEKPTTNWHIGRILIKKGDVSGISIIKEIKRDPKEWHWRGNDLVLLGIGYFDLLENKEDAKKHFKEMIELYEKVDDKQIKARSYGVDNALANVKSAHARLCSLNIHKNDELCRKLQFQETRLTEMRKETLENLKQAIKIFQE